METATATNAPILTIENEAGVVHLTLNRPERRNALSRALLGRLEEALAAVAADPSARVVVLGSRGPVFCSGHDLSEMTGRSEAEYRDLFELCSRMMLQLRRLPQPVIARVQGMAIAAGCQLVAACDLAVAAETATFTTPGVKIGLFCTTPMVPLVRAVPDKAALEMLFTGAPITAERAYQLGLVNRVVPADQLQVEARHWADKLAAMPPVAVRVAKSVLNRGQDVDLATALQIERLGFSLLFSTEDQREGVTAFLEKRVAEFRGR